MSSISNSTTNVSGEVSYSSMRNYPKKIKHSRMDSNDSNSCYPSQAKCPRHESDVSASKFKGVVSQLNGHWGAQIYAQHQRIWLGTFRSEKEAAMAYDSAATALRNGDSFRNFPSTSVTAQEPDFQTLFSTEAVLSMIKDGSYTSNFTDFLNLKLQIKELEVSPNSGPGPATEGYSCRQLFQKELTPSDVGKLNRLVIPKKNAVKYFPQTSNGGQLDDVQLEFYDTSMRLWKFRYCYWKSSQSYVFTRGWNKFVKEKGLTAKDTVIFSVCRCSDGVNDVSTFGLIDVSYHARVESNSSVAGSVRESIRALQDFKEENEERASVVALGQHSGVTEEDKEPDVVESVPTQTKGFRLFGVQIV